MAFTDYYPKPDAYQANYGQSVPAFPPGPLDFRAALQLAGQWDDVTPFVYQRDQAHVQRGRPDEASTMTPSSATMTLNNRDGRFTTRNPVGAYYPALVQNTPLRLSVPAAAAGLSSYLRLETDTTSYASTPDAVALQITGPIDIRVDVWLSDYQNVTLAGKWSATASARSWVFELDSDGTLGWFWADTASTSQQLKSNMPLPYFGQRIALRVQFTPSTGTAIFYTAPTMAGPWTQLGTSQVFGATTLRNGAGSAVQVGAQPSTNATGCLGMVYEAQILSSTTLEADPVFSSQAAGATSFTDAQGNVWTLNGTAEISDRLYRFHGELSSFPKAADPSGNDVYSQAGAFGPSQRLQNSNSPLNSPMYRAYARLPSSLNLAAYWPGEDASGATQIGQAIGQHAMTNTGLTMASSSVFASSAPLPVMNGGTATALVDPASVTWTDNVVRFLLAIPSGDDTNGAVVCQFTTTGTIATVRLVYGTGGSLAMQGYNAAGTQVFASIPISPFTPSLLGGTVRVSVELTANGGSPQWQFFVISPGGAGQGPSGSFAGTVGAVTTVAFGGGLTGSAMGHFSVQGLSDPISDLSQPLNAWFGETAGARFARICSEEGIACRIVGSAPASAAMGNQPIDTLWNILQQCENTDLGMLFEPRQVLGLGYRTRTSLYNQAPLATANFAAAQVFQGFASTGDTLLAVNDVTANAPDGSTARQQLLTGAMSVLPPSQGGIGRIDTQISPSPAYDSVLNQIASWYLSLRSTDDDRYPAIPFQMARTATPVAVATLDIGDYLQITGTPPWIPPGPVKQLCAGTAETYFPAPLWEIDINGIPEKPYEIAISGDPNYGHAGTAGSTVHANAAFGAATFQADTNTGPLWSTAGADYPVTLIIGGMTVTVSACSGTSSPQTFTVSAWGVNGVTRNLTAGQAISIATPARSAL